MGGETEDRKEKDTVDLVLRKRGELSLGKANGPEFFTVTEMPTGVLVETINEITKWFQRRLQR